MRQDFSSEPAWQGANHVPDPSRGVTKVQDFGYGTTKVVEAYGAKYSAIDTILLDNPALLDLAHADFVRWLSDSDDGRESRYTSEELLRTLVVRFLEQDSYRDVVARIETCEFLRSFIGFGFYKPMMDFTLVSKAFSALWAETWKAMNEALGQYAQAEERITGERMRLDTTVYEAHIHYATDSSLLWDSYRVQSDRIHQQRGQTTNGPGPVTGQGPEDRV